MSTSLTKNKTSIQLYSKELSENSLFVIKNLETIKENPTLVDLTNMTLLLANLQNSDIIIENVVNLVKSKKLPSDYLKLDVEFEDEKISSQHKNYVEVIKKHISSINDLCEDICKEIPDNFYTYCFLRNSEIHEFIKLNNKHNLLEQEICDYIKDDKGHIDNNLMLVCLSGNHYMLQYILLKATEIEYDNEELFKKCMYYVYKCNYIQLMEVFSEFIEIEPIIEELSQSSFEVQQKYQQMVEDLKDYCVKHKLGVPQDGREF